MRDYLRGLRKQKGLSMQAVADALGFSKQYYAMIESRQRKRKLDLDTAVKLADFFGIPLELIIDAEDSLLADDTKEEPA